MSLREQLDEMTTQITGQAPDAVAVFEKDTQRMVDAGVGQDGPKVGDVAPDFELPDQLGRAVKLNDLLAGGPVVVSFYRGNWCPYCNLELAALKSALPAIREAGGGLVAISPQVPDESLSTVEKHGLEFSVLSDVGNVVGRRYGLVFELTESLRPLYASFGIDLEAANGNGSYELPVPGTFVIGRDGVIAAAHVSADYKTRMEPDEMVEMLRAMG